tara:strand:- start:243 stop:470 length:228 start_codon:yes stop_codon:yes gene_type:complete
MNYKTNKTQGDLVANDSPYTPEQATKKIVVPGIQSLHMKSTEEIAEVLSNVLRSQSNVVEIRYVLGEYIELTTQD